MAVSSTVSVNWASAASSVNLCRAAISSTVLMGASARRTGANLSAGRPLCELLLMAWRGHCLCGLISWYPELFKQSCSSNILYAPHGAQNGTE